MASWWRDQVLALRRYTLDDHILFDAVDTPCTAPLRQDHVVLDV